VGGLPTIVVTHQLHVEQWDRDRESSPASDRRSTTVQRNHLTTNIENELIPCNLTSFDVPLLTAANDVVNVHKG